MKVLVLAAIAIGLLALGLNFTAEAPFAILFGWIPFLGDVLPRVTVYWPSMAVGAVALVLLIVGVHWMGLAFRRPTTEAMPGRRWRLTWTLAAVSLVMIAFAAGVSIIGIVHQVGWLLTSDAPLLGETLADHRHANVLNEMRMVAQGIALSEDLRKAYPPASTLDSSGQPLHGWETQILPFLAGGYVSKPIDQTKPWNDPDNQKYFKCILPVFINPDFRAPDLEDAEGYGLNYYSANAHVIKPEKSVSGSDIGDGASTTIIFGEINADFRPWGRPGNARNPESGLNRGSEGFGGPPGRRGAYFSMADGSARLIRDDVDPEVLKALSTPNGGEESRSE